MDDKVQRENMLLNFAKLNESILRDVNKTSRASYKKYKKENIATLLADPNRNAKEIQNMSKYLYDISPHYHRMINYFGKMSKLDYYIEPFGLDVTKVNEKALRTNYFKALDFVELMNIKHEFKKAMVSAWKYDTFYGYEYITKDSYYIQELPYEYCQISGIIDGVFTFSFDLTFFDKNPEQLEYYPKEFKSMFNSFKGAKKPRWQEVDPNKTICLKVNEESINDMPPFVSAFPSIFDVEDYKAIKKASTVIENYKFLIEKIPIRDDTGKNNDLMLDLDSVTQFHNYASDLIPEEIGIFPTPMDIEVVEFKKDTSTRDNVVDAERELYSSFGTSKDIFNGDKSSTSNLSKSIQVDEAEVFALHRQIERIINLKLKNVIKGQYGFRIKILDNTIFNHRENKEELLKNAQYGLPVKTILASSLGLTPSSTISMAYLENQVLGLTETFVPLSSSHTQSGETGDTGGRPTKGDNTITDSGQKSRDNDVVDDRNAE